ncbi:hypothetical protein DRV84_10900 [Rhodosalinus sediminis]|uniref:Uncharacterized protein n=1 Tax=Rhodosalinus sediminis TaxID=1940533 RepID=A0A3D9BRC3_9RHOB|nr:hypothetical protein [Rhodosalinus sediminis]REC55926.1 hypothetical protein DRV84_10900 [Rhodosalinus sediminis]
MSDSEERCTYPGGIDAVLEEMEARRAPLDFAPGEALPPRDVDLAPLRAARVPPPAEDPERRAGLASPNRRKYLALREELAGRSELACLHGLLVAHLRKRAQPPQTAPLFVRLWAEEGAHLLEELNLRWQVSALTTFGTHGATETQRMVGESLSTLFAMMKLYETERRYSGFAPAMSFRLRGRSRAPLPLEMDAYSLDAGGLDVNLLGRLWRMAEGDAVIRPLAHGMLDRLMHDPRTVFRRLRRMRVRKARRATRAARAAG